MLRNIRHIFLLGLALSPFFLSGQTLAPDEDGTPYTTCNADGANATRTSNDLASPVNVGTIDDRSCYANYKESSVNGTTWGVYNITDGSNNQDAANTLQPRIERSLNRSQTSGVGSYAKLTGTFRILEVGSINGVSNSNDGTYIMQAKGKHTGEGGSADPAICLYLAKPVFDGGGNQVSFDIYREQINYRGGSGADGRTLVYLTNITKNVETSIELEVGFKVDPSDSSKKIHYANAIIGGTSYDWDIPEPERGLQSGIRYGAYRVKGGRAQIRWANTVYEKVENEDTGSVVASSQSWDFKTDLDPGDWVKGTQTLDAAIVADGLEVTWEASGVAGANPQNKPKIGITSGAAIDATNNKILAVTLINNSTEPIDVQVKFPRNSDGTDKFYSNFGDDIPASITTATTYYLDLSGDSEWTGTKDWIEMQLRDTGNTGRDNASSAGSIIFQKIEFIDAIPSTVTITSAQSGNFEDTSTWDGGVVPVNGNSVNILTGHDIVVNNGTDITLYNVTIGGTGSQLDQLPGSKVTITGVLTATRSTDYYQFSGANNGDDIGTLVFSGFDDGNGYVDATDASQKRMRVVRKLGLQNTWYLFSFGTRETRLNEIFPGQYDLSTTAGNENNYSFAYYDTANSAYVYPYNSGDAAYSNSTYTEEGRGYALKVKSGQNNVIFRAKFQVSDVSINISDAGNQFNLIGNPYTCFLHGNNNADATNNLLKINGSSQGNSSVLEEDTIWLWDATNSQWITKNLASDAFRINPLQGFFVKAKIGGGISQVFNFTQEMQSHSKANNSLKSSSNRFEIDLSVAIGKKKVNTSIRYIDNMTTDFDNGYDSSIFGGYSSSLEIYTGLASGNSSKKLAIQSLPNSDYENMVVPVGVTAEENSEITFTAEALNVPTGYKVYLEDRLNNTFTRLDEAGSEYKATVTNKSTDGRFFLHTRSSTLSTDDIGLEGVNIYTINNNTLRIAGVNGENSNVKIFSILGKKILETTFSSTGVKDVNLPELNTGVYIVNVSSEKGKTSKKIVIE